MKIAIYAAKPGSKVVLVGLGQRDKMYELPITHAAVSYKLNSYIGRVGSKVDGLWCSNWTLNSKTFQIIYLQPLECQPPAKNAHSNLGPLKHDIFTGK